MVRLRFLAVAALGAIAAIAPAWALTLPEPPPDDGIRENNELAVERALRPCSADATRSGLYEVIYVRFAYETRKPFSPTLTPSSRIRDRGRYGCVVRALERLRLPPLTSLRPAEILDFALGDVRPLFPQPFLAAWQRAGARPERVREALRPWLPPEVEVTSTGCLHFVGPMALGEALHAWLRGTGGQTFPEYHAMDEFRALPGGWWLHHTSKSQDLPGEIADERVCLDQVDGTVGALRRNTGPIQAALSTNVFDAEWVVDGEGRMAGDLGVCLAPARADEHDYSIAEAAALRARIEAQLRGIALGAGPGPRRVILRYGPVGQLEASATPADGPLDRADSIEARCDQRRLLRCTREGAAFRPGYAFRGALLRFIDRTGLDKRDIMTSFELSPDGAVEKLRVDWVGRERRAPEALRAVFDQLAFPRSEGGRCFYAGRLDDLLAH